jgi:hypothetical protein
MKNNLRCLEKWSEKINNYTFFEWLSALKKLLIKTTEHFIKKRIAKLSIPLESFYFITDVTLPITVLRLV